MSGKTISTTLSHAVTISSSFSSPLTIISTGAIEPGTDSGTALLVPEEAALVTTARSRYWCPRYWRD